MTNNLTTDTIYNDPTVESIRDGCLDSTIGYISSDRLSFKNLILARDLKNNINHPVINDPTGNNKVFATRVKVVRTEGERCTVVRDRWFNPKLVAESVTDVPHNSINLRLSLGLTGKA